MQRKPLRKRIHGLATGLFFCLGKEKSDGLL
jgi:hypothetical protein